MELVSNILLRNRSLYDDSNILQLLQDWEESVQRKNKRYPIKSAPFRHAGKKK